MRLCYFRDRGPVSTIPTDGALVSSINTGDVPVSTISTGGVLVSSITTGDVPVSTIPTGGVLAGAYKSRFAAMTIAGQNIILPDTILFCPKFGHYIHILPFLDNIFIMGHV